MEDELSNWIKIKRGIRHCCILSPDLFSLYSDVTLRETKELRGLVINEHNMNNVRYADDSVLITETEEELQLISDQVIEESESLGLSLNVKKTYILKFKHHHVSETENLELLHMVHPIIWM